MSITESAMNSPVAPFPNVSKKVTLSEIYENRVSPSCEIMRSMRAVRPNRDSRLTADATPKPLPPVRAMNVLACAAKAIKGLEDNGLERRALVEEQSRVRNVEHDRHDLSQGIVALRRLIDRYCDTDDKHFRGLLTAIEEGILYRLDDEANGWLTLPGHVTVEGRPRRADLDRLAGIVLSLAAQEHWSIPGAAHAVADLLAAGWAGH